MESSRLLRFRLACMPAETPRPPPGHLYMPGGGSGPLDLRHVDPRPPIHAEGGADPCHSVSFAIASDLGLQKLVLSICAFPFIKNGM